MSLLKRWRNHGAVVDFMFDMKRLSAAARIEASSAGMEDKKEFYDGVLFAVDECSKTGKASIKYTESEFGRGYRAGWALMMIARQGIEIGVGLPPIKLPPFSAGLKNGGATHDT